MAKWHKTEQNQKIKLKVTQASLNQTALDFPRNLENIYAAIREAVEQRSDILAFEELTLTGYEANDDFQRTDNNKIYAYLQDIADYAAALDPNLILSIGHPWRYADRDIAGPEGAEVDRHKDPLYNRLGLPFNMQTMITGGKIVGMTAKSDLFNDERGYEKRYFAEWSMDAANRAGGQHGTIYTDLDEAGQDEAFIGRPIVYFHNGQHGFYLSQAICEEKWVATKYDGAPHNDDRYEDDNVIPEVSRYLGSKDGLVMLLANASPPARDKIDKHIYLNKLASLHADAVIDTDGLGSSGSTFAQFGHRIVAKDGQIKNYGARMSFARVATTTSVVEVNAVPVQQAVSAKAHVALPHEFKTVADAPSEMKDVFKAPDMAWDDPDNPDRHYEEMIRYTAFWLFDYMRKTKSKGIMEALSGGADSSFNSVIVAVMVNMAIKELGAQGFCQEMDHLPFTDEILAAEKSGGEQAAIQVAMKHMLTGVYMGTNNSSDATQNAARFLIEGGTDDQGHVVDGIGGKFKNRNVQDLLDFYGVIYAVEDTTKLSGSAKDKMMQDIAGYLNMSPHTTTPQERLQAADKLKQAYPIEDLVTAADGIAYENIQARGREVLIMLFANKEGKMAVANPNLDEARNAYATFGGDLHSGTINLNAHIPKDYQLGIMRYLHDKGVQGVMAPVKALGPTLKNKPSAELLPKDEHGNVIQNDEDAMQRSFAQMNRISELMLHEKVDTPHGGRRLNATEVFEACQKDDLFKGVSENQLYNMVRVSYYRWGVAQHKIHATPVSPTFGFNVDHQTSLRTPNISGNSKDELTELAVSLLYDWAEDDGVSLQGGERSIIEKRALQDESFIKVMDQRLWKRDPSSDMDIHLRQVYDDIKQDGWDGVFGTLSSHHPISIIAKHQSYRP